ncbi:hypothetical protein SpCBS45565_g02172 [Spizellomyces sp. 'palustris']|nr:hypothetical protein SpCBS45565_g02172 [Spizellomyces sp. 'palustris']
MATKGDETFASDESTPLIVSAGSLIIDDIVLEDGTKNFGVMGGAGAHATIGARIWLPSPTLSKRIGYIANIGDECPPDVVPRLNDLHISFLARRVWGQPQPRAWNTFGAENKPGHRAFRYQTPEESYARFFRVLPDQFPEEWIDTVEYIHLITSPTRLIAWVEAFRKRLQGRAKNPYIVWEPSPESCRSTNWNEFLTACGVANVVSPNHEEAKQLATEALSTCRVVNQASRSHVGREEENCAIDDLNELVSCILASLEALRIPPPTLLLRAAERGCLVVPPKAVPVLVPAYWTVVAQGNPTAIVDVTGAGNSFLGGWMAGHVLSNRDAIAAACYGSVSASFTLEQVGCPVSRMENGREVWSGCDTAMDRLKRFRAMINL